MRASSAACAPWPHRECSPTRCASSISAACARAQRDSAVAEVKTNLLLDRIAEAEDITVSDEEMDRELQIVAIQSREPLDTLKARLTQDGGLARIREQMRREKTAQFLYERLPA